MRFSGVLLAALIIAVFGPSAASAETALLLPSAGDDALKTQRQQAQQVLSQALQSQAIRVLTHAEATAGLGSTAMSECKTVDCAPALLQATGADIAVAVGVWASGGNQATTVFVTLVDRRSDRYPGKGTVTDDDLAGAVKDALLEARALQLLGPGPWLRVRGEPRGAQVFLNGTLVGSVPYRGTVQSGRHTLEVRYEGYRTHAQTIDVAPSTARQVDVDVALKPRDGTTTAAIDAQTLTTDEEAGHGGSNGRAVVGPIILGAVGLGLITVDAITLLGSGCGSQDKSGNCLKRTRPQAAPAIVWGVAGIGAVVGAVLWYALSADDLPTTEPSALRIDNQGITVSGTF